MKRSPLVFVISAIAVAPLFAAGPVEVRRDGHKLWIQCESTVLEDVLQKVAEVVPMELWLEDDIKSTLLSADIEGEDMRDAFEELMENAPVNYVLYFDAQEPQRVTKLYVGGGSAKVAQQPSREAPEPEPPPIPDIDALDIEELLMSPETAQLLEALREVFEQQGLDIEMGDPDDPNSLSSLPEELQKLLPTLQLLGQNPAKKKPR